MEKKFTILYVDDEESNLNIFKNTFRREYNILVANSAIKGLEILKEERVDLILTDQRMPEMDGVEFLKHALMRYPNLNRILITAYSDFFAIKKAINEAQIFQYLQKPWTEENLRQIIEQALDVSRIKKENEELSKKLAQKNVELEKINTELIEFEKLKMNFLSTISHEIRTPLNGLRVPIELIKEEVQTKYSDQLQVLFYILENSVDRLEQFVLSAERITWLKAKKYNLKLEKINLYEIVYQSSLTLKNKTIEKQISIKNMNDKYINILVDTELFKICINVLLGNAVKYSNENDIVTVKSNVLGDKIEIEVIDEGRGFSEIALKNIFKLFTKGGEFVDQNLGIDLALVKLIVDAHKGKIEVWNNETKGATVKIELPIE